MSKVIKNNDGVAVVEGTPAASLIKDVDKIFATKPPERMAGEIAAPVNIKDLTDQALVSRPAPGSTVPLGPNDIPLDSPLSQPSTPSIFEPLENATIKGRGGVETEPGYAIGPSDFIIAYPNDPRLKGRQLDYTKSSYKFIREKALEQEKMPFASKDDPDYAEKKKNYFNNMEEKSSPELAVKKAKSFQRERSSLEAERSEEEKQATKGKFITTLGR